MRLAPSLPIESTIRGLSLACRPCAPAGAHAWAAAPAARLNRASCTTQRVSRPFAPGRAHAREHGPLLRRVESHGVLRSTKSTRNCAYRCARRASARPGAALSADAVVAICPVSSSNRVERDVPQLEVRVLDSLDTGAKLGLRELVAGLTSAVDVEQRASHMMGAIFIAPTRWYACGSPRTLRRACVRPWLYIRTSGCCALRTGAPLTVLQPCAPSSRTRRGCCPR